MDGRAFLLHWACMRAWNLNLMVGRTWCDTGTTALAMICPGKGPGDTKSGGGGGVGVGVARVVVW